MRLWRQVLPITAALAACLLGSQPSLSRAGDPLAPIDHLSDEFDNPATLADWTNIVDAEQWPAEQLEVHDIAVSTPGRMTLIPYSCGWFEDYRGPFLYKEIEGDYVATIRVHSTNRAETGAPSSEFSLAGLLSRAPRPGLTAATWTPGGENYSFLSLGAAGDAGQFQFEVKTTENGVSTLIYENAPANDALIQTARVGPSIIHLRRDGAGGPWTVHRRYNRPDLPATMQVGLFAYTDWPTISTWPPADHNNNVITHAFNNPGQPANPDLRAEIDFIRFQRPQVPAPLQGLDLSDPGQVSDAQLLSFLGETAVPVELSAFSLE
jgi:hypothetical protein